MQIRISSAQEVLTKITAVRSRSRGKRGARFRIMKSAAESLVSMDAFYNPRSLEHRGLDTEAFKRSFLEGLVYTVGKDTRAATRRDWFTTRPSAYGTGLSIAGWKPRGTITRPMPSGSTTCRWSS